MKIVNSSDIILFLGAFCAILAMTLGLHLWSRLAAVPVLYARKLLHVFAIGVSGWVIHVTGERVWLAAIFLVAFVFLLVVSHRKLLFHEGRTSYGIAFFALALGLLLLSPMPKEAVFYGAVVTAICDPLAGWAGMKWGAPGRIFLFEKKSWPGFFGFYLSCLFVSFFYIGLTPQLFLLALLPALTELFSWRGSDNLAVPVISAIWFTILSQKTIDENGWLFTGFLFLGIMVVHRRKWLTSEAMAAAIWVGSLIFFSGGWSWLAVITIFFLAGSLSSHWLVNKKEAGGRNAIQVYANGLIASCCALIYALNPAHSWLMAFLVSVGIALADTLSSDIGVKIRQQPYDVISWRPVPIGLSGGISLAGTLAGALGAGLIAIFGGYLFALSLQDILLVFLFSQAGMLADSALGSLVQAKYSNHDGLISEELNPGMLLIRGSRFINNDGVNILANILVVALVLLTYFGFS